MTKRLSLLAVDKILSANRKRLRPGKVLSRAEFVSMLQLSDIQKNPKAKGSYVDLHRENMKLVAEQQRVNKLMRLNGLYLKSKDYYSEFEVCSKDDTKGTIVRYAGQVDRNVVCEETLDSHMVSRLVSGTWSTYNRVLTNKGQRKYFAQPTSTTVREETAIKRVKNY
jgi:hypothetical protein